MNDVAIRASHVGKRYRLGGQQAYTTLRERVMNVARSPFRRAKNDDKTLWALDDVSFEIRRGEAVGIVGRNGAGKSTLLKVLSRITEPSNGEIEIIGRVGSLLEVGTGFHPELTGRENIFLNGAILGMKKTEIAAKFDEIVAFADVEKFVDTAVKHYSSGMYMRLAFAVAAHLEPEILVVDEVLAVGDAAFQKKCLGKMDQVAEDGRTVLFVSHNMQAISTLTKRSILMRGGKVAMDAPTMQVVSEYLRDGQSAEKVYVDETPNDEARVRRVELRTSQPGNVQVNHEMMEIHFELETPRPLPRAAFSFQACNELDVPILHLWNFASELPYCATPGRYRLICRIPKVRLYMGQYTLTLYFGETPGGLMLQKLESICPFEVTMFGRTREVDWSPGTSAYTEDATWEVERVSS